MVRLRSLSLRRSSCRRAGYGAEAGQSFAGDVVRHETAVGVAEEVDRPEVLDCHCFCCELGQIGDIILAGLAAIAAVVGGVPKGVSLGVE